MVLATANSFWRGVLKSLEGLGFHGIDEGNLVEILMPELIGEEVEKFIESLYDAERFVIGKTNHNKVYLLEEPEETNNIPNPTIKEPKDLSEQSATTELTDSKGKAKGSIEAEIQDSKYINNEFDHATDGE